VSLALSAQTVPLPPPPRLLARHRGVTFHEERFSWLRHEGDHLLQMHYREASADLSVPLDMNWELYEKLEQAGVEACVVARKDSEPIGYAVYIIVPQLHYRRAVADDDLYFIHPRYRSGWLGVKLFRVAEALVREHGASVICARVKFHVKPGRGRGDLGPVFRYLGYRPIETHWQKRIA